MISAQKQPSLFPQHLKKQQRKHVQPSVFKCCFQVSPHISAAPLHTSGPVSIVNDPVDRSLRNTQALGDLVLLVALPQKLKHLSGLHTSRRFPALEFTFGLSFGYSLSLPLQHHLSFKLSDGTKDIQHELPCSCGGIKGHVEYSQCNATLCELINYLSEMTYRTSKAVKLGDYEDISFSTEAESFTERLFIVIGPILNQLAVMCHLMCHLTEHNNNLTYCIYCII